MGLNASVTVRPLRADAQAYFTGRVADLDGVCHEPELTYWAPAGRKTLT
jgi:hypothetical protein